MGVRVGVTLLFQTLVHAMIWLGLWYTWNVCGAATAAWFSFFWHTASNHAADVLLKYTRLGFLSRRGAVIVTGAGRGLGKTAVVALVRDGYTVIATVRDLKHGAELKKLVTAPERLHVFQMDVGSDESVKAGKDKITTLLKQASVSLIGLINNAGILIFGPVESVSIEVFDRTHNVNVDGIVRCCQAFLPLLRESAEAGLSPRIANVSSVLGFTSQSQFGSYCCSKYAVEGLSDALRREISSQGIGVTVIEPGFLASDMSGALTDGSGIDESLANIRSSGLSDIYEKDATIALSAYEIMMGRGANTPAKVFGDVCSHIMTVGMEDLHTRYLVGLGTYGIYMSQRFLPDSFNDQGVEFIQPLLAKYNKKNT